MRHAEPGSVRRAGSILTLIAAVFLAVHVAQLPATLEDLDSINFARGVREFDLVKHQPHPPGFPVYIALGRISTGALRAAGVSGPEARGLALWGALGAALSAFSLFVFFRGLDGNRRRALAATLVTMCAPLFWFTANRPLSDMTGLAAVLAVQALAMTAWARQHDSSADPRAVRRIVIGAAAAAGVAIGIRVQTAVLTLPLLAIVLFNPRVPASRRVPLRALAACAAGVLVWAIPLLIVSGGVRAYLAALNSQGTEDFSDAVMLVTHPTIRTFVSAVRDTVLLPWANIPLASVMLSLAAIGAGVVAWRSRTAFLLIAASVLPYIAFTLLFQEVQHGKYAIPVVPATAYLAVVAIDAMATAIARAARPLTVVLQTSAIAGVLIASLWTAAPALSQYGSLGSPVFQAIADIDARAKSTGTHPVVVTHADAKRVLEWVDGALPGPLLKTERGHEWLAAVRYWLGGGHDPVWFLARPGRTDLALIDPAHRRLVGSYRRPFDARVYTGGARPNAIDWYEMTSPGWFLDRGWSLTPEVAGVTKTTGQGPHLQPAIGYVRRRPGETLLMIGGVVNESVSAPPVHLRVDIDDRPVLEWDQTTPAFLRMLPLAAGMLAGNSEFARLGVRSSNPGEPISVKLEQFDLQDPGALVWGFDDGWMELEYDPAKELLWRWSGATSAINIHNAGRDVTIRLRGESPLKYVGAAPHVKVTAGDRTLSAFSPDRDFLVDVAVPAAALQAAHGLVVLETDRTFQPRGDPRRLGLRLFEVSVR